VTGRCVIRAENDMLKARGRRWPWAVACGVATVTLLLLGVEFYAKGLAGTVDTATLIALTPAAVSLFIWARAASRRAAPPGDEVLEETRRTLAGKVREQWLHEASVRQLYDPAPLPVIWRMTERPVTDLSAGRAAAEMLGVAGDAGDTAEMARRFWALERRRLVIIGDRGMGKTTLAILLVLEILKADQPLPVPVMFSLASYDAAYSDLDSWLTAMLARDYPWLAAAHGPGAAGALVRRRWILPVLDGLDEVPGAARPAVIDAVNRALADGELGVILTCRTQEYMEAVQGRARLRAAAVLEPDAVRRQDARAYLQARIPDEHCTAWEPILASLDGARASIPLTHALGSPLMLWLISQVYRGGEGDPAALADPGRFPSEVAIRAHLLGALIPALVKGNPPDDGEPGRPRRQWDPAHAQRWLCYLALHLNQLHTPDLAWWRLGQAVPPLGFGLSAAVAIAIGAGLGAGLPAGPTVTPLMAGLAVGPVAGLSAGLGVGLLFARWRRGHPGQRGGTGFAGRLRTALESALVAVLVTAVGAGVTLGLAYGLSSGITNGPVAGVKAGLGPALAAAAAAGLGIAFAARRASPPTPARGLRWHFSVLRLLAGLASGVGIGAAVGIQYGLGYGSVCGVAGCVSIGLAATLEGPMQPAESVSPQSALAHDRWWALVVLVAAGLGIGFVLGIGLPVLTGLGVGLATGLSFGLLVSMLRTPWLPYTLARSWLALRGRLPWPLMAFLADAHQLGILRQVGMIYQFRHIELQDHLAGSNR
jgi:hypothetical protein